jgi:flagellar motor switch protein FliM
MLSFAKKILSVFKILLPFHASAWKATSEPIRRMLEEGDEAKRDKLTANWRESTQTQLSTISVTVRTLLHQKKW